MAVSVPHIHVPCLSYIMTYVKLAVILDKEGIDMAWCKEAVLVAKAVLVAFE